MIKHTLYYRRQLLEWKNIVKCDQTLADIDKLIKILVELLAFGFGEKSPYHCRNTTTTTTLYSVTTTIVLYITIL